MKETTKNLEETAALAKCVLQALSKTSRPSATVVGLRGNLGAGKTTFVQNIARLLGISEHITSPTFVIMKSYPLGTLHFQLLTHVDAYRLKSGEELLKLNFAELLANPANLIFVEWPEHVESALPKDVVTLDFTFVDDTTRTVDIPEGFF